MASISRISSDINFDKTGKQVSYLAVPELIGVRHVPKRPGRKAVDGKLGILSPEFFPQTENGLMVN